MGRFDSYKVDLKSIRQDIQKYEYLLDNQFFVNIDGEDIQKGKVNVELTISKQAGVFDLSFTLVGNVIVPCDHCLDDMELPIETTERLVVKLGKDYAEESDEIVIIPETEGIINLSWFLFEFVALAIPIKHVHAPGKCNKQMTSKLKKHLAKSDNDQSFGDGGIDDAIDDDDRFEDKTDPRWNALRGLQDE